MNSFKFHSVGQGLFYTGSLAHKTYNFVYDCGTKSKNHYLSSAIDSYIKEIQDDTIDKPKIEFVVISHLHKDHFSGLFELAQKTNIRKVYLPYLGNDKNLISLILAYIILGNNPKKSINQTAYSLFYFMCGLYGVENNHNFPRLEGVFLGGNEVEDENNEFAYSRYIDYLYVESRRYWKFVFINRGISRYKLQQLNKKMYRLLSDYTVKNIVELISKEKGVEKIAQIYGEVFSSEIKSNSNFLNMTSTVLLHYPLYSSPNGFFADSKEIAKCAQKRVNTRYFSHRYPCEYNCYRFERIWNPSTILAGDVLIDNTMENLILSNMNQTGSSSHEICGVLQVPHHGSKDNWIAWSKTSIDSQVHVISFGLGNNHRHPHSDTIEKLISSQKNIQLVNQIQDFIYYID